MQLHPFNGITKNIAIGAVYISKLLLRNRLMKSIYYLFNLDFSTKSKIGILSFFSENRK